MSGKKKPTQQDQAFTGSDNHALADLELQPWTPSRVVAAQSMGMLYPSIGNDGMEQFRKTHLYPGCLRDIVIVLWLCSLVDPVEVRRADRSPDEAYDKALAWASGRGITKMKSDAFWSAYEKFMDIVTEVADSTSQPVENDGDGDDGPND